MSTTSAIAPAYDPFEMTATSGGGGEKELPPSGTQPGVCIGLIYAGMHSEEFSDGNIKDVPKQFLLFETPGILMKNGHPFVLVMEVTGTFSTKSNLRKLVESWRGKAFAEGEKFNLSKLLGQKCLCNVAHKKTTNGIDVANLIGVSGVPQGMTIGNPTRTPFVYSVLSGERPPEEDWIPWSFGKSIADVCRNSREWKAKEGGVGNLVDEVLQNINGHVAPPPIVDNGPQTAAEALTMGSDVPF